MGSTMTDTNGTPPENEDEHVYTASDKRATTLFACLFFSSFGIFFALPMALTAVKAFIQHPLSFTNFACGPSAIHAWIAFLVMAGSWVAGNKVNRYWPIAGTITGLISATVSMPFSLLVTPSIVLAFYLVGYHLDDDTDKVAEG